MKPRLVIMLTNNDKTVSNALETFDQCKDLPVDHWGFKNVGLPAEKMKELFLNMKKTGKTTLLEVVTHKESSCLESAKFALECQFDYFTGSKYFESVRNLLKNHPIKYFPFCGKISGSPNVLEGSIEEIIEEAQQLEKKGVDGFDLLGYRYSPGDPKELIIKFLEKIKVPTLLAGSIDSYNRLDEVKAFGPWAFTIGSAFFNKKFVKIGSFKEQVCKVLDYINNI